MTTSTIRLATAADLPAINEIYNYYVHRSTCTYQVEPEMEAARQKWFEQHSPDKHPVTVALLDEVVIGWGALSPFRPRAAYAWNVEASVYIRHDVHRRGIGIAINRDRFHAQSLQCNNDFFAQLTTTQQHDSGCSN